MNLKLIFSVLLFLFSSILARSQKVNQLPGQLDFSEEGSGAYFSPYNSDAKIFRFKNDDGSYSAGYYDGEEINMIPNPSSFDDGGSGYRGISFFFNDRTYSILKDNNGVYHLCEFDGDDFLVIPNPPNHTDSASGCTSGFDLTPLQPVSTDNYIFNNKLYLSFRNDDGITQMYEFDGDTYSLIPNPTGATTTISGFREGHILFNDKLFVRYRNDDGVYSLYKFDGNELSEIPNPPNHNQSGKGYHRGGAIVFNNKLFLTYIDNDDKLSLWTLDANDNFEAIQTPNEYSNIQTQLTAYGYSNFNLDTLHNKLYMTFLHQDEYTQLFTYDGDELYPVPLPPNAQSEGYGVMTYACVQGGDPNTIYFNVLNENNRLELYEYTNGELNHIPKPSHYTSFDGPYSLFSSENRIYIIGAFEFYNKLRFSYLEDGGIIDIPQPPNYTLSAYEGVTNDPELTKYLLYRDDNDVGVLYRLRECQEDDQTYSTIDTIHCAPFVAPDENEFYESGEYTVVITNSSGCDSIISIHLDIPENCQLFANVHVTNSQDEQSCDGSAQANIYGGVEPFSVEYSNGATTDFIDNLCEGVYEIEVTDDIGNYYSSIFVISNLSEDYVDNPDFDDYNDSLFTSAAEECGYDYTLPPDTFYVDEDNIVDLGDNQFEIPWVIYQEGNMFTFTATYYITEDINGAFAYTLTIYCEDGRSELAMVNFVFKTGTTTNVSETYNDYDFLIFPNPAQRDITIKLPENLIQSTDEIDVRIYNLGGQLLSSKSFSSDIGTIDLRNLSEGVYIVKVMDKQELIGVHKIVKIK